MVTCRRVCLNHECATNWLTTGNCDLRRTTRFRGNQLLGDEDRAISHVVALLRAYFGEFACLGLSF
jgi:hypothetical protein